MTTDVIQIRMRSAILKNIEDPAKRGATRPKTSLISGRKSGEEESGRSVSGHPPGA